MTKTNGNYILTFTGRKYYAEYPSENLHLVDQFHALSRNNRFTGHGRLRNITVGEHVVRGVKLILDLYVPTYGIEVAHKIAKEFLLHDNSEAYLQDIASPFKALLPDYLKLEEGIQNAIYQKYLGYVPTAEEYILVKQIDLIMLVNEMDQIMQPTEPWNKPDVPNIIVDLSEEWSQDFVESELHRYAFILGVEDND